MNTGTQTLYHRDGHEETFDLDKVARMASCGQVGAGREWSNIAPPPPNWEREIPRYLVTRDLQPAPRARYRSEPPFSTVSDSNVWQYCGAEPVKAGQEISSTDWPHPSMLPLTFSAEQVLNYFKSGVEKSRLPTSPWFGNRVRLAGGVSGNITIVDMSRHPAAA